MFANVYRNPTCKSEEKKTYSMLDGLYSYYYKHPDKLPEVYLSLAERFGRESAVCDYIAGMSDRYAVDRFIEIYVPASWKTR
jgi:dGTPase